MGHKFGKMGRRRLWMAPNEKWRQLSFGFQLENRNSISLHQFNGDLLAIVGHHGYTEDQFIQKVTLFKLTYSGQWGLNVHPFGLGG